MELDNEYITYLKELLSDKVFTEMALKAYSHKNFLVRKLFFDRLKVAVSFTELSGKTVLDYGTGSGILLPYLSKKCSKVYAADIFVDPAKKMMALKQLDNVSIIQVNETDSTFELDHTSLDVIFALDVLEHIKEDNVLNGLINKFSKLLKIGGSLIISGPTENFLYQIARKLTGFKNDYHFRNIYAIKMDILATNCFKLKKEVTLPNIAIPGFKVLYFERIKKD